jgi:hypothetical protein
MSSCWGKPVKTGKIRKPLPIDTFDIPVNFRAFDGRRYMGFRRACPGGRLLDERGPVVAGNCMRTKLLIPCTLMLAVLAHASARAQQMPVSSQPLQQLPDAGAENAPAGPPPVENLTPSNWMLYSAPPCCGPIGGDGPIKTELYVRNGISFPMGGGYFPQHLNSSGYTLEAGGRSLFFNEARDHAWVIELGVTFDANACDNPEPVGLNIFIPVTVGGVPTTALRNVEVTASHLYRTYGNLSVGREWYLWAPANAPGKKWRVGADLGARYGTARATFNEIRSRTDDMWGAFGAVHSDIEIPCGACIFVTGIRVEWGYTWMNILQSHNDSNIADLSVLYSAGFRF